MIPQHIAIIMDGNRRWAKKNKLSILRGHEYAADKVIENIVEHAAKRGVRFITFWAFSTENWKRNKREVDGLLNILRVSLKNKIELFIKKGVRLKVIGDLSKFPDDIKKGISQAIEKTQGGKNITAVLAINYGGRDEIIRAIEKSKIKNQKSKITQDDFNSFLDTAEIPDPELIIRTGGEKRLSGFLLWQSEYAELYFCDTLWPDFSSQHLDTAILDFQKRDRRYGK